jgi:NTE family protein
MGHRRVWVDSLGAEWRNELAVGRTARAATEFYQPFDVDRIAFASAYASTQSAPRYVFIDSQRVAEYAILANSVGIDLGLPFRNAGELRIGPQYTFWRGSPIIASPGYQSVRETDAGVRALARWDNLDNAYFPTRGLRASLDVFYGRRTQEVSTVTDTSYKLARGEAAALTGFPITPDDFVNVAARAGAFSRDEPSLVNPFLLGGLFNLSGLRDGQLSGTYVGFARAVYYHRLARWPIIGGSVYAGGSLEAGNAWELRDQVSAGDLVKAGSVFLAADTFLGPVYFAYGRATGGQSSFYLLLGRPP